MTIQEIYSAFDKIGCLTFSTINEAGEPESRIAHLRAYDEHGLYFMTMYTKGFYRQLNQTGKLSLCGLCANSAVQHDEQGMPVFSGGYAMRLTGTAQEVSLEDIKAKNNPLFDLCIKDQAQYNAMVVFCITSARGDIFDYDFKKEHRGNKLERIYFSYGGAEIHTRGLWIDKDACIRCGICEKKCSFMAIRNDTNGFAIRQDRCDECGDCFLNCPAKAIHHKGEAFLS